MEKECKKKQFNMDKTTYNQFGSVKRLIEQKYGRMGQDKVFKILVGFAYNNSDKIVSKND